MHILVLSALRRQRQKDQKFEATLDYVVNFRPARATCEKLVENNNTVKQKRGQY